MKNAIVFSLIALLLNSAGVFAQAGPAQEKDLTGQLDAAIIRTLEKVPDIPGFAIVVIKDDKPIFTKAYGLAVKETGRKADTDTLWYMGSTTKSFTAMVAAMLDKEGKIKLDDP